MLMTSLSAIGTQHFNKIWGTKEFVIKAKNWISFGHLSFVGKSKSIPDVGPDLKQVDSVASEH